MATPIRSKSSQQPNWKIPPMNSLLLLSNTPLPLPTLVILTSIWLTFRIPSIYPVPGYCPARTTSSSNWYFLEVFDSTIPHRTTGLKSNLIRCSITMAQIICWLFSTITPTPTLLPVLSAHTAPLRVWHVTITVTTLLTMRSTPMSAVHLTHK